MLCRAARNCNAPSRIPGGGDRRRVRAINSFDMIFTMTGGGPGGSTEIFGLFVYRLAFNNFDFGGASAVSVVLILLSVGGFGLYAFAQARQKRGGAAND